MNSYITSKKNAIIKKINSLYLKKNRDKENLFVLEGLRSVNLVCENALNDVDCILITEEYKEKFDYSKYGSKVFICSDDVFKGMADTKNAQGILAICKKQSYDLDLILKKENAFVFVCDNIQDPGNAGTLIRTVDSIGADAIIFTQGSVDLYNPKVIRSTVGSILNVKIFENINTDDIIEKLNKNNIFTYGTSLETNNNHYDNIYKNKVAVFLGNEANGLTEEILSKLDYKVKIPMEGKAESLNVGVAGSIIGYEILRQKKYK